MAFVLNKNLVFTDSMQFMSSSLEKLVKNLSESDFKYLTQEFDSKNLELLKQKDAYPYEYMNGFKRFSEKNYLIKHVFTGISKLKQLVIMVKNKMVTGVIKNI